ncbi:MAG: glutamine synthetase family protein [Candidatus Promineifilaceae bacterium]|nr:glutamine synthetase family protein [Candidatus Promineifilaceae bacterium]
MSNKEQIAYKIEQGELQLLRFVWCDNSNVMRAKSIYLPSFLARMQREENSDILAHLEQEVTITAAMQSVPATRDEPAPAAGLPPVEDVLLVPAWETFAQAPGEKKVATIICNMFAKSKPWVHCPRSFLQRMELQLADHDLVIQAGFELEFYLLQPAENGKLPVPVDHTVFATTSAAHKSHKVINKILKSLQKQNVPPEQYLAESGPGQQEITLERCHPLQLADRLVRARGTVHNIAGNYQLVASFLPLIFPDATGSGLHVHMSLWQNGQNHMAGPDQWGLSDTANSYMAGILKHLPALMAVTTPSKNSYRRIKPHAWSGAFQAWGIGNKEAALRLITNQSSGKATNFELKTMDASANPYIALGCIIAAGLDGIRQREKLPNPVEIDPGSFSPEERSQAGIKPLPTNLEAALAELEADQALLEAMTPEFARVFAAVRRFELQTMAELSFEEERLLLLERY